ncbi:helix-turn-helix domain-containing protein [Alistipes indistinctus]|uniref:helix-turn-helix domain-containing protein n=1 Tax=Alistipes indistinctus TaxID=626932 RepID=UPI00351FFB3D
MITETIINEVAQKIEAVTGFSLEEIKSKSRYCPLVRARIILVYELRLWNLTYIEIGNAINRNHSTLTHYLTSYRDRYDTDPVFRKMANCSKGRQTL